MKCLIVLMFLLAVEFQKLKANDVFYVLSDNSVNVSCSSQPCHSHTLGQYLLINNGMLPQVTNVEYHFLPGEHHIPANMMLTNLCNFSITGDVSEPSSPAVLVGCDNFYVLNINGSHNVSIRSVWFKRCYNPQLQLITFFTSLYMSLCHSCVIENVTFKNFGMVGENLIGESYLNEIYITHVTGQFCQGITLVYINYDQLINNEYYLLMNKIYITVIGNGSKCYNFNEFLSAGVQLIAREHAEKARITVSNSIFYRMHSTALYVISDCETSRTNISIYNCLFDSIITINEPVVYIELPQYNNFISFNNCTFKSNYAEDSVVSILIKTEVVQCRFYFNNQILAIPSNVYFRESHFKLNSGKILYLKGSYNIQNTTLYIIGPSNIIQNTAKAEHHTNLILIERIIVCIYGPLIISHNSATEFDVLQFVSCELLFYGVIVFKSNVCDQVISLNMQQPYIKVLEYTNITFNNNKCGNKLIGVAIKNGDSWYNYCLFQYITFSKNATVTPNNYAINVISTSTTQEQCSFQYYHFNSKCEWLPNVTFQRYDSEIVNHQIIQIDQQHLNYHRICICHDNGSYNCSENILGPVYPGQVLQIGLCTPFDDNIFNLYVETHNSPQANFSCRISNEAEVLSKISNDTKLINYTIVSEAHEVCQLFLKIYSHKQLYAYEVFYVKLLSCPVGFTLQDGMCDCDPILTKYIDKCYIDYSVIRRPANTWITAHTLTNDTNYLISDCPMDYCLPHSFNVNLLYPDQQCQFERIGILCSQCQQPLSMVFGSSRCMKCTNLYILITIIIIVAGIALVVALYLLNLTVTKGTINGIILYANIISINDSIFLTNRNVFLPLKVFVSFTNLDLGIETCFYDGMDSYAKMWLQLFFPFYLVIIAVVIIIASRYSPRIFRLTHSRSLSVLATLFLLSYTGILRTVLTVLFSYSTITHLPSGRQQIVWSIDASVPLFGVKFTILFVTCLLLFLLLIPFNTTLLFSRYLSRFRIINQFKPFLDAFNGPYKDEHYNWIAVNIILRSWFFVLYGFASKLRLLIATITLIIYAEFHGYIHPNKNKIINIQEFLLLLNLTILYAVSCYCSGSVFSLVTNIMISLALVQFLTIVLYHFLTYTCDFDVVGLLRSLWVSIMRRSNDEPLEVDPFLNDDVAMLDIDGNVAMLDIDDDVAMLDID